MRYFGSTGCPFRRELFDIEQRQCDGQENLDVTILLQRPLRVVETYNAYDVV